MMNKIFFFLVVALGFGCGEPQGQSVQSQKLRRTVQRESKKVGKLERLQRMSKGKVIPHCDLSYDNLRHFPNLSGYTIHSLDLSHNQLDTVIVACLPKGLVKLNLSYNQFRNLFKMSIDPLYRLSFKERKKRYASYLFNELNVSHNQIKWLSISFPLKNNSLS